MTDAPLRIWATRYHGKSDEGFWDAVIRTSYTEYHLHTREALAQSPIVQAMIAEAWRDGFMVSGEGWNGEYPGDEATARRVAELSDEYAAAIRRRG
jgi:hypothetical protein